MAHSLPLAGILFSHLSRIGCDSISALHCAHNRARYWANNTADYRPYALGDNAEDRIAANASANSHAGRQSILRAPDNAFEKRINFIARRCVATAYDAMLVLL